MSGSVQQILEGKKITDIDANIGTVSPTSFICAFDILFAVNKSEFHRKIKDLVVSKRPNEKIAINEADDTSSDNRKIFLNSQHSSPSSSYCSNELDETNESISDELSGSNDVKNHFRPTSSSTYKSVMPCELMIFSKTSFSKVLRLLFESKYLDVLNTLFATHIFDDWKYEDIVMLARMGNIKHYKIEDFVTKQGGKADYFYIILRGTCGVYRHQNESGLLRKRLQELQKQADFHDQLYVYHHISSTRLRSHSNQLELSNKEFSKILDDYHGHGNHIHREINNTNTLESTKCRPHTAGELVTKPLAEIKRAEIQKEIESIEEKLSKLNIREGEETTVETIENFEIARLKWPMMFGEESILNPDIGEHPTTIKCLTGCEIFQIHSSQMKSFPNSEHFKEKIQLVAIKPPDDNLVHERISSSKKWEVFKSEYIVSLQTNKIKKSPQKISKFCF
jgi:CRP-like cAMP-binding protein